MKWLRIFLLLAVVATGGYLAFSNQSAKTNGQDWQDMAAGAQTVGENGELLGTAEISGAQSGLSRAWAKIRNAFDGKRDPVTSFF